MFASNLAARHRLREMAAARLELARLEIAADLLSAKRLAVAWLVALVMALTSLPLVAVWLAEVLGELTGIPRGGWLLGFAACLLLAAGVGGYLAWRRFRRNFLGLRETLEELREDVLWLKEKSGSGNAERKTSDKQGNKRRPAASGDCFGGYPSRAGIVAFQCLRGSERRDIADISGDGMQSQRHATGSSSNFIGSSRGSSRWINNRGDKIDGAGNDKRNR